MNDTTPTLPATTPEALELRDCLRDLLARTPQDDAQYLPIAAETQRAHTHDLALRALEARA